MLDPGKEVYKIYEGKCDTIKVKPIVEEEFIKIWNKGKDILIHMIKNKQGREPYVAVKIDDRFTMYQEIRNGNIVTNIWTKDQYEFLLGKRRMYE